STAMGKVACASCCIEQTLTMPGYEAFRLHGKEHMCTSCASLFNAEHVAVRCFLAKVEGSQCIGMIAGTLLHPKTLLFAPKDRANMDDLCKLFDSATWAQHAATLPALPTWADVESLVLAPIMAATADSLSLPGNRRRFAHVVHAHHDVMMGPWSMDLVRAVQRQRRFSKTMFEHVVSAGCGAIHAAVAEALVQYPKFLAMMVTRPVLTPLVPTGPIDLAWHTHQLSPAAYAVHTCALTGHVADHDDLDDDVSKASIANGAKAMPDVWRTVFDEDYYRPNIVGGHVHDMPAHASLSTECGVHCRYGADLMAMDGSVSAECGFHCWYAAGLAAGNTSLSRADCGYCLYAAGLAAMDAPMVNGCKLS
ncbi:hypothetical protein GGF32_004135, partial [Allomyces javanicus]